MKRNAIIRSLSVVVLIGVQPVASYAMQKWGIDNVAYGSSHNNKAEQVGAKIPETGQLGCFDNSEEIACPEVGTAFFGQDYQYRIYRDNGDGTVTDTVTGLMWEQTPENMGFSYEEAAAYCESLDLGEYDDWRVPRTKELFSISDFLLGWPYLDTSG